MSQSSSVKTFSVKLHQLAVKLNIIILELRVTHCGLCSPAGGLQGGDGFLPVWHHGELLLAAGGGHLPSHSVGRFLLLREEILLVVHSDWLGYAPASSLRHMLMNTDCSRVLSF